MVVNEKAWTGRCVPRIPLQAQDGIGNLEVGLFSELSVQFAQHTSQRNIWLRAAPLIRENCQIRSSSDVARNPWQGRISR